MLDYSENNFCFDNVHKKKNMSRTDIKCLTGVRYFSDKAGVFVNCFHTTENVNKPVSRHDVRIEYLGFNYSTFWIISCSVVASVKKYTTKT